MRSHRGGAPAPPHPGSPVGLGPARAAGRPSGATALLLTDGAERVALHRQTLPGSPHRRAAVALAGARHRAGHLRRRRSALVLAAPSSWVPVFIAWCHSRLRAPSSDSDGSLAAEYLDAIQGLAPSPLARAAERTSARLRLEGSRNRRAVMGLLAGNQLVILPHRRPAFSLFLITVAAGLALVRLSAGAIDVGDASLATSLTLPCPSSRWTTGAFFYGHGRNGQPARHPADPVAPRPASTARPGAGVPSPAASPPSCSTTSRPPGTLDPALEGVNLSVRRGESLAVVGPWGRAQVDAMAVLAGNPLPSGGPRASPQVLGLRAGSADDLVHRDDRRHNLRLVSPLRDAAERAGPGGGPPRQGGSTHARSGLETAGRRGPAWDCREVRPSACPWPAPSWPTATVLAIEPYH